MHWRSFTAALKRNASRGVVAIFMASLMALASHAQDAAPSSDHAVTLEGVMVSAPEPRYVAPTLRDRIGRIWAPVYINGQGPFRLVLDTGANRSAVIPALANRLGGAVEFDAMKLHGVTGSSLVPGIRVDSLEAGDLWLGEHQLAIVQDVFGGAEGVLGADGLIDKRVVIDFRRDQISIRRSSGRAARSTGFTRVPVSVQKGHLLLFEVKIAGVRTRAMLDTGAQATIGNRSLQAALAAKARHAINASIVGVTLDVQPGETVPAPPVDIGDITIRGMRITFGDMHIFDAIKMSEEPALLIGMDVIGLLDSLIIDYGRKELQLLARSRASSFIW